MCSSETGPAAGHGDMGQSFAMVGGMFVLTVAKEAVALLNAVLARCKCFWPRCSPKVYCVNAALRALHFLLGMLHATRKTVKTA